MTLKQKRAFAYVLAGCAIAVSVFLWADLVRGHARGGQQASVVLPAIPATPLPVEHSASVEASDSVLRASPVAKAMGDRSPDTSADRPAAPEVTPVTDSAPMSVGAPEPSAPPRRPLLPSLRFPSSAVSSRARSDGDDRTREELRQWEIHEAYGLSIPRLGIRVPVFLPSALYWDKRDWDGLERQMQVGLLSGLVAYPHSAVPGHKGTIVVAGHSSPPNDRAKASRFGQIFAQLPDLKPGDTIILYNGSTSITYAVTATRIVPAGDTGILAQQSEEEVLTLITCYPVGTTRDRLVVSAKRLVE